MKLFIFLLRFSVLLMFLIISLAFTNIKDVQNYNTANPKVFINEKQLTFDQEPIIVNNRIFVPLRAIAESLGAEVIWHNSPNLIVTKGENEIWLSTDSTKVYKNLQTNRQLKIFFLEQPPIIVNNRTMVSLRFIACALGAKVVWNNQNRVVSIYSDGDLSGCRQPEGIDETGDDKYYKLYDVLVGASTGPDTEEAKAYVLKQGLLKNVKDVTFTPIYYFEASGLNTMVIGIHESGREKAVWLTKNMYTGDISLTGSVFLDEVISEDTIYSKLEVKGIDRNSIQKLYLGPYEQDHIYWFVTAKQGDKRYFCCFDYKTGDIAEEKIVNN